MGKLPPEFVWVDSPASGILALRVLSDTLGQQLCSQIRYQLWDHLRYPIGDHLGDPFRYHIGDHLRYQIEDQLRESVDRSHWYAIYGAYESHWGSDLEISHRLGLVTYPDDQLRFFELWSDVTRAVYWWWPHHQICVLSDRPTGVHLDSHGRLHCQDGPALSYADGWGIHARHGKRIAREEVTASALVPDIPGLRLLPE